MAYRYPPTSNLPKLLQALREVPASSEVTNDGMLFAVYNHLKQERMDTTGDIHWFCERAKPLSQEAAAFSLRLFAYHSDLVTDWKGMLHTCLSNCASCVQVFEAGKITWRETYFGAFSDKLLGEFYEPFEKWQLEAITNDINKATTSNANHRPIPLASGTLYRIFSKWPIFSDSRIQTYLQSHVPPVPVPGWPEQSLPSCLLVLLVVENANLRAWARSYASRSRVIEKEDLVTSHAQALTFVVNALAELLRPSTELGVTPKQSSVKLGQLQVADGSELWSGLCGILRLISPEWFHSGSENSLKLKRTVLHELRLPSTHFTEAFKCFNVLLKRLGKSLWMGEGPEYPVSIFDSIKDNTQYHKVLESIRPPDSAMGYLAWLPEYLSTLRSLPVHDTVFTKMIEFLSMAARHDDLQYSQPLIAKVLMNVLYNEYSRLNNETDPSHCALVESTLNERADMILSIAYGNEHDKDDNWRQAREKTRELVETILEANVKSIVTTVRDVCEVLVRHTQGIKIALPTLSVQENIWKALYSTLRSGSTSQIQDNKALAKIINILSRVAHIAPLRAHIFSKWNSVEGDKVVKHINDSILVIQNGFSASISTFLDYGASSKALEVLQCENAARSIIILLLSPAQDLQTAAKTLVGMAFDVDGRMECFRALFENLAPETFNGIFRYLETFCRYVAFAPEACNLSAMMVLCFADILDVLCASPDGLLRNSYFLKTKSDDGPAARMLQFWKHLTRALSEIYKRTPAWANHIEIPEMVLWMRDALILARDVLTQWRVVESAAIAYDKAPTKPRKHGKVSAVGEQMIDCFNDFLPKLFKWLRLTDEELLHQSFSLVMSVFDLLKETHISPSQDAVDRLVKYVGECKSDDKEQKTRLDKGRLTQLEDVLVDLDDKPEDDEIEVISYTAAQKKPSNETQKSKDVAPQRPFIQGKNKDAKSSAQRKLSSSLGITSSRQRSSILPEKDQKYLEASIPTATFRKSQSSSLKSSSTKQPPTAAANEKQSTAQPEESEEEPETTSEDDAEFRNLGKPKNPVLSKPAATFQPTAPKERRQIIVLDDPLNLNKNRISKQQQRAQAPRMKPDCSGLHKTILSWDYRHTDPVPPGAPLKCIQVPNKFKDYNHYFQVFQPLLLMECWAQILAAKEEPRDSYQCIIESRQYVDSWIDLDMSISESVKKDWYLAETDIVLLKHVTQADKCIMAKVKVYKASVTDIKLTVRCFIQGGVVDPGLAVQSLWQISKVFSLSTLDREYRALLSLQFSDISQFVMQPRLEKMSAVDPKDMAETMETYKVNEPQATAILKALKTNGVSLIQGPPGTGKTSTICGLIARFLACRPRPVVTIIPGQPQKNADAGPTARVLVCAPSNAAIDELAQRIRDGRTGSGSRSSNVNIVRIGAEQTISSGIRDISLDYLVDQKLDAVSNPLNNIGNEIQAIRQELDAVKDVIKVKTEELANSNLAGTRRMTVENEKRALNSKRSTLISKLDQKKDQRKGESRAQDAARRTARSDILLKADIICSTLAGSGHESLDGLQFDMIVIDEAAQAIELSSLIPLRYGSTHCIMVGDPQQLPPTVISPEATRFGYNQSLFVRLQRSNSDAVHLLSIQYRMHPSISYLPSKVFYGGRLLDGPDMASKTQQPWHDHDRFGTYKFLNVAHGIEQSIGRSISNPAECKIAADLFDRLRGDFRSINFDFRIGVVSMYKAQIQALRRTFQERFGSEILRRVDFNTVDGFQGQEKDVIILSCVRAGPGLQRIGFTADVRRMNVALTRAKSSLFILGNAATLERSDETWRAIVQDARSREALVNVDTAYYTRAGPRPDAPTMEHKQKKRKVSSTPMAPTIPKLSTPKEFKADVEAAEAASVSTGQKVDMSTTSDENPPKIEDSPRGTKRTIDTVDHSLDPAPAGGLQTSQDEPKTADPISTSDVPATSIPGSVTAPPPNPRPRNPEQPPRKRQKQQTMFIPSKKRTK